MSFAGLCSEWNYWSNCQTGNAIPSLDRMKRLSIILKYLRKHSEEEIEEHNEIIKRIREERKNNPYAPPKTGFIYFASNGKHVKIGLTTRSIEERLEEIKKQVCPKDVLKVIHTIKTDDVNRTEQSFHTEFKDKRIKGEWFKLTEKDIQEIKEIKEI